MGCFSFRRGDMVWVRAIYPHSWCPALVLRTDLFGVLVSFFGSDPPPRYFLESQVCSFEHNFASMVGASKPHNAILSRALTLVSQRASLSLKCPCLLKPAQMGTEEKKGFVGVGWDCKRRVLEAANGFLPAEALRFVLGVAVSPWIEDEGLVAAVTVSAQVDRFRRYSSVKQRLVYREGRNSEKDSGTIAQKVATLGDKHQISSESVDDNLTDSLTIEVHMKKTSESLQKDEANCVRLKRQLEQSALVQPCSKLRKTKPFFSLSRAYAYLQKYGDSVNIDVFDSFSSESLVMFNVPLIEHTSLCSGIVEIDNCQKREDNAYTINDGATCKSCVNMPEPEGKTDSSKDNGTCKSFADLIADVKDDYISSLPRPSPSKLLLNDVVGDQVSCDDVGSANVVTTKTLLSPHTIDQHNIQSKESDCVTSVWNYGKLNEVCFKENYKEIAENQDINSDNTTSIMSKGKVGKVCNKEKHKEKTKIQYKDSDCDDASVMDNGNVDKVCIEEKCKNTKGWLKDSDHATSVTNNEKVKKVCFKERCDENAMTLSKDNRCATSATNNGKVNKVSFEEKSRVIIDLPQSVTANLSLNSQSDRQPESLDYSHSTVLHMKFPNGIDPPSKEELIRKFRPYGPIDILNTKLSPYTGAARVVFLHHVDASNAYKDAKKERVLVGQLNIRFWLDPFDHKRGIKFLQPTHSRNHKPCLRIASSVQSDEKKAQRVRFLTSPSSLPPLPSSNLKSCLKTSSCLGKDKKKDQRVRFIMRSG